MSNTPGEQEEFDRLMRNLAANDMAEKNRAYYLAHLNAGFTEEEAMEILKKFIETRLILAHSGEEESPDATD